MICPKCGMQLPDDSEFCQYCGTKATSPVEQVTPPVVSAAPVQDTIVKSIPTVTISENFEGSKNTEQDSADLNPTRKSASKKWIIVAVSLAIVVLLSASLNVYQYISARTNVEKISELSGKVNELNSTVDTLNGTIADKESQIKNKNTEITNLKNKVSSMESAVENYETIVNAVKYDNLGYAASNFQSSESVIVVSQNEKSRKFTLTANWSNGGNVSVDYDSYFPSAYVDFDHNSWTTSTKMTIEPRHSGVTVVTFSNDVNRQTFDVIIIVE